MNESKKNSINFFKVSNAFKSIFKGTSGAQINIIVDEINILIYIYSLTNSLLGRSPQKGLNKLFKEKLNNCPDVIICAGLSDVKTLDYDIINPHYKIAVKANKEMDKLEHHFVILELEKSELNKYKITKIEENIFEKYKLRNASTFSFNFSIHIK